MNNILPLRNALSPLPLDLVKIVEDYAPETTVIVPVKLTLWENIRKFVLNFFTCCLWSPCANEFFYWASLENSIDGSGINDAIKWIKWGVDPANPLFEDMIYGLRDRKLYKEFEFALAHLDETKRGKLAYYDYHNDPIFSAIHLKYPGIAYTPPQFEPSIPSEEDWSIISSVNGRSYG